MVLTDSYKNAFAEADVILKRLNKNDYNKIPNDVVTAIEKNKNNNYSFELNSELDLDKQEMLPETRAILLNIFREYLANDTQREKIKIYQQKERNRLNETKKEMYSENVFREKDKDRIPNEEHSLICVKNDIFISNIIKRIKAIFTKK